MTRFYNYLNEGEKTTPTEDLHEIFFALAILGQMSGNKKISSFKNLQEILKFIEGNAGEKLGEKENTIETLKKHIKGDKEAIKIAAEESHKLTYEERMLTTKQKDLLKDAEKAGIAAIEVLIKAYKFNSASDIDKVWRVFATGQKSIADDVVEIKVGKVLISLKYQKGQFNNLSIPFLIEKLYGINMTDSNKKKNGILTTVYKTPSGKTAINNALKYYLSVINKQFCTGKPNAKISIDDKIEDSIEYMEFQKRQWSKKRIIYKDLYRYLNSKATKKYQDLKIKIHEAIDKLLDSNSKYVPSNDEYIELLTYLFRAEKNESYLYVASGGKKMFFMPSQNTLEKHKYRIDVVKSDGQKAAVYKRDMNIYIDGGKDPIIEVDLTFRWSQGQFNGEYVQKGTKIEVHYKNFK